MLRPSGEHAADPARGLLGRGRGRVRVRVGERKRVRDGVIIGSGLGRGLG